MNVVSSKKFSKSWLKFIDYALNNYGETIATKKKNKLVEIIKRLEMFPLSGHIDPYLQGREKVFRVVKFEDKYNLVYCIENDSIILVNLLDTFQNPKNRKKRL